MPGARSTISLPLQRGLHERHPRQFALGEHIALPVDHHPGTVEVEAGLHQRGLVQRDAGAGLDGVHEERGNGAGKVAQERSKGSSSSVHCAAGRLPTMPAMTSIRHSRARRRRRGLGRGAGAVAPGAARGAARRRRPRRPSTTCAPTRSTHALGGPAARAEGVGRDPVDARTPVFDMHVQGDAAGAALDFSAWTPGRGRAGLDRRRRRARTRAPAAARFAPHVHAGRPTRYRPRCRCWPRARTRRRASAWVCACRGSAYGHARHRGAPGGRPAARRPGAAMVPQPRRAGAAAASTAPGPAMAWAWCGRCPMPAPTN